MSSGTSSGRSKSADFLVVVGAGLGVVVVSTRLVVVGGDGVVERAAGDARCSGEKLFLPFSSKKLCVPNCF